jgi:hypothetical protein
MGLRALPSQLPPCEYVATLPINAGDEFLLSRAFCRHITGISGRRHREWKEWERMGSELTMDIGDRQAIKELPQGYESKIRSAVDDISSFEYVSAIWVIH